MTLDAPDPCCRLFGTEDLAVAQQWMVALKRLDPVNTADVVVGMPTPPRFAYCPAGNHLGVRYSREPRSAIFTSDLMARRWSIAAYASAMSSRSVVRSKTLPGLMRSASCA